MHLGQRLVEGLSFVFGNYCSRINQLLQRKGKAKHFPAVL